MKTGPIILIDDDEDDKEVFEGILEDLGLPNTMLWFKGCEEAFAHLKQTNAQPFVIFCDQNMPGLNGIECKKQIDEDAELRRKSIPFVFFSTSNDPKTIEQAYTEMTVQGYFQKKSSYEELKHTIKIILDYWSECRHPNSG